MNQSEMELMLTGHGLTTAQIFYRMPDFESVIQTYVWQDYDTAPDFPKLFDFLDFWKRKLEGPLHSVQFTHRRLIQPGEWRNTNGEFLLN
jgi:uncharacterized protein Usg